MQQKTEKHRRIKSEVQLQHNSESFEFGSTCMYYSFKIIEEEQVKTEKHDQANDLNSLVQIQVLPFINQASSWTAGGRWVPGPDFSFLWEQAFSLHSFCVI